MYQSALFIEECKEKMNAISNWGFVLSEEKCEDKWALLTWELEDIRIAIEYHPYAYTLSTYVEYMNQDVNVRTLYDSVGVKDKYVYQFGSSGLEKGIESIAKALLSFLSHFDLSDHKDLKDLISKTKEQRDSIEAYELKRADQFYLSGKYDMAKKLYLKNECALNSIQKMRLDRIKCMS